jgi:hypothetical protein
MYIFGTTLLADFPSSPGQPMSEGQDQTEEQMGPRGAEIWVSTEEAGDRLRWESIKGVQIVRQAEGISFQGPGEDEMKEQQRIDPELVWVTLMSS